MEDNRKCWAKATSCSATRLALFAALCALLPACASVVEIIADPPVQFLDGEKKAKYIVAVDRDGDAAEPPALPGVRTVIMADKTGKKYTCNLPSADADAAKNGSVKGNEDPQSERKQQATPSELLDDLTGLCFYRAEDWWTYEICYKRHVRQFHREHTQDDSMKIAVEYSLGEYNATAVNTDIVQVDTSPGQKQVKYVSQLYDTGETCDITGGRRQTEVRYSCGEGAKDLVVSIKEPSTCHYVMNVRTPRVCAHPEFTVEQLPVLHILCSALPVQLGAEQQTESEQTESGETSGQPQGGEAAAQEPGITDAVDSHQGRDDSLNSEPDSSPTDPLRSEAAHASDEETEDANARTQEGFADVGTVQQAAGEGSADAPAVEHDEL